MKKLLLILLCLPLMALAQKKKDVKYEKIDPMITGEDNTNTVENNSNSKSSFFWGSSFDYAVYTAGNIFQRHLNDKKQQRRIENERQSALAKLTVIKEQYSEYETYPEIITDGWHSVILTDNMNFCKDAKVLVNNNKITRLVHDNWLPMHFNSVGKIKNAKNTISIQNIKFNDEQLNIVTVYFLYDIEGPNIVSEPNRPGCVCFWSDLKRFDAIILKVDNVELASPKNSPFSTRFRSEPPALSEGMVCKLYKPGNYNYTAFGKGRIDWKGSFKIKQDYCTKIRLGK